MCRARSSPFGSGCRLTSTTQQVTVVIQIHIHRFTNKMGTARMSKTMENYNWFPSRVLPFVPTRQNLSIFVFRGVVALRALPLLLGKSPLYIRRGISKQRRVRSLGLVPSMVGTGFPVASNWFCVNPSRCRRGDSAIVDNLTSLCGREKYKRPRRSTCCWSLGGTATLWMVLLT